MIGFGDTRYVPKRRRTAFQPGSMRFPDCTQRVELPLDAVTRLSVQTLPPWRLSTTRRTVADANAMQLSPAVITNTGPCPPSPGGTVKFYRRLHISQLGLASGKPSTITSGGAMSASTSIAQGLFSRLRQSGQRYMFRLIATPAAER